MRLDLFIYNFNLYYCSVNSMKNKYLLLKKEYTNNIILIKSGTFYITFSNDALILNNLFSYEIKNDKLGFPINTIDKIINKLNDESINYTIYNDEKDIIVKEFNNNKYFEFYKISKDDEYNKSKIEILIRRIEFLIDYDKDNYERIRKFLDEL